MEKSQIRLIVALGFLIMLVQHLCMIIIPVIVPSATVQIFYLDILGFLIIGVGYILLFTTMDARKNLYAGAGVCFVLWALLTFVWRVVTNFYGLSAIWSDTNTTAGNFFTKIFTERIAFSVTAFLAALFLFVGSILIYKAQGGTGTVMLITFAFINFIGMAFLAGAFFFYQENQLTNVSNLAAGVTLGLLLKIILVPILGLVSFLILLIKASDVAKTSDVTKTVATASPGNVGK